MSDRYLIVLRVICDDPEDDARLWPFHELLANPDDGPQVYVSYVTGAKEAGRERPR